MIGSMSNKQPQAQAQAQATRPNSRVVPQRPAQDTRLSVSGLYYPRSGNVNYLSGKLSPQNGEWPNGQPLLDALPPAPEGFHWRFKIFFSTQEKINENPRTPDADLVLELCPNGAVGDPAEQPPY